VPSDSDGALNVSGSVVIMTTIVWHIATAVVRQTTNQCVASQ